MTDEKRTFFHNGTKYIYTGNHTLAHSHFHEVRNHLGAMKRVNVNNLPVLYGQKHFTDGTTAQFQINSGIEIVQVSAPKIKPVYKGKIEPRKTVDEIEQIVPCIRSYDGRYWIACLSGTFDGPYYAFENIYDIPVEAFSDNKEIDLNNQLISVGSENIEDSIDVPQLFFIAQTGKRPEAIDYGETVSTEKEVNVTTDDVSFFGCIDSSLEHYYPHVSVHQSYSLATNESLKIPYIVFGNILDIPPSDNFISGYEGVAVSNKLVITRSFATESEAAAAAASNYTPGIFPITPDATSFYITETSGWVTNDPIAWSISVRAEQQNTSKFCAVFREVKYELESWNMQPEVDRCNTIPQPMESGGTERTTYSDFFKIDDRVFELRSQESEYPNYTHDEDCMKYYNTGSIAAITAIMSLTSRSPVDGNYIYDSVGYYYVGPNSKNNIAVTEFVPVDNQRRHTIQNIQAIPKEDALIDFNGEIFLGRIVYEVERKLSDRIIE